MMSSGPFSYAKASTLTQAPYDRFAELDLGEHIIATYIWVDTLEGEQMRGKSKVLNFQPKDISELPNWDATGPRSMAEFNEPLVEWLLKPVAIFRDPFLKGRNILVLCDVYFLDGTPAPTNHRHSCVEAMEKAKEHKPWFGIEQEYIITTADGEPLGWPHRGLLRQGLGPSHCGAGAKRLVGRHVADSHLRACIYAGLKIDGTNAEAVPAQWEYQVGPCEGIEMGDHLWVSRYLLQRVAEEFGLDFTMDPKPVACDDAHFTTGAHCNFSFEGSRNPATGMKAMQEACEKLAKRHAYHLTKYDLAGGEANKRRLSQASREKFTWGIGDRDASVRIPGRVAEKGHGYLEDRRPSGNADPYLVTDLIVRTTLLDEE